MKINVLKVNAFTDKKDGGNPAGVLLNSPELSDKQMAYITKKLNVSETAFVYPSEKADFKVVFFTPEKEVELCGHATIATFFTMALKDYFKRNTTVIQETKAGILPVDIIFLDDKVEKVMMTQNKAIYKDIYLDISIIGDSLNIKSSDIDNSIPNQAVSTGLFTLPICVKSFEILKSIKPDFKKVRTICKKNNFGSFHVFTFDTIEPRSIYHARNFAPYYGVNEDPVTGTANGAVCSYLLKNKIIVKSQIVCEQGDIIGRSGRVFVDIIKDKVKVGGLAKIVEEVKIKL
jgi:PhzF family phenazine biosynthesis protein